MRFVEARQHFLAGAYEGDRCVADSDAAASRSHNMTTAPRPRADVVEGAVVQGLMSLTSESAVPGQTTPPPNGNGKKRLTTLGAVTVRFAGDSGDGMQLAGTQFTDTSALVGNDIS